MTISPATIATVGIIGGCCVLHASLRSAYSWSTLTELAAALVAVIVGAVIFVIGWLAALGMVWGN